MSKPALGPTQPLVWVLWVKQLGHEADYSPPSSADVKNGKAIPPLPILLLAVMLNQLGIGITVPLPFPSTHSPHLTHETTCCFNKKHQLHNLTGMFLSIITITKFSYKGQILNKFVHLQINWWQWTLSWQWNVWKEPSWTLNIFCLHFSEWKHRPSRKW
jgi:hypothetical protein